MTLSAVIFDLDNTLYKERTYYHEVIREAANQFSLSLDRMLALVPQLLDSDCEDIFGELLRHQSRYTPKLQEEFFEIYRSIKCNLSLTDETLGVLRYVKDRQLRSAILTNGDVLAQKNKVSTLGIEQFVDNIVFARAEGKEHEKPAKRSFDRTLQLLNASAADCLFVGDNFYTDIVGAKSSGLLTAWLAPEAASTHEKWFSDFYISTIGELKDIVNSLLNQDLKSFSTL